MRSWLHRNVETSTVVRAQPKREAPHKPEAPRVFPRVKLHELPEDLERRVRVGYEAVSEVVGMTVEEVLTLFRMDDEPEKGLEFWEAVVHTYTMFVKMRLPSPEERQAAYNLLSNILILGPGVKGSDIEPNALSDVEVEWLFEHFKY
jgi:hypothetical protein